MACCIRPFRLQCQSVKSVLSIMLICAVLANATSTDKEAQAVGDADHTVIEIPLKYYDQSDDHAWTDNFIGQLVPVRRENIDPTPGAAGEAGKKCVNVTCHPQPHCAEYKLVAGECCARCERLIRRWRTCPPCQPVEGCLKYQQPKRGRCCAACVKRKNRVRAGPCATTLCPPQRVCREDKKQPVCVCKTQCPGSYNPVCGTNGVTYYNPCHRKREECETGVDIPMLKRTAC